MAVNTFVQLASGGEDDRYMFRETTTDAEAESISTGIALPELSFRTTALSTDTDGISLNSRSSAA